MSSQCNPYSISTGTHLLCENFVCEDEAKARQAVGFDDALQVNQFITPEYGMNTMVYKEAITAAPKWEEKKTQQKCSHI